MRNRTLGRDVRVTELGLGASQFGNLFRETTDQECHEAFDAAWDAGIRYFDTAPHYGLGLSEKRLGALLRTRPRDEYVVSTKVGRLLIPTPEGRDRRDPDFDVPANFRRELDYSADGVRRSLEESLDRLGLDHVDIVYVHDPDEFVDQVVAEAMPELARLRDLGVVGAVGAGMNDAAPLARLVRETDLDVVMVAGRLTLLDQSAVDELIPDAVERGVAIVAAGVYNTGLLSSPTVRDDARFDYGPAAADTIARARAIAEICNRHGVTLPEAALAYPLRFMAVASVVVGGRTADQVNGSVARAAATIPDDLWRELQHAAYIPSETGDSRTGRVRTGRVTVARPRSPLSP